MIEYFTFEQRNVTYTVLAYTRTRYGNIAMYTAQRQPLTSVHRRKALKTASRRFLHMDATTFRRVKGLLCA